jgi:hypothetical protein
MRKRNLRNAAMAFALASAVGLGACGDDGPVGIDDENVERIQLVLNSEILAEYDGTSWGGALNVTEGTSTEHFDRQAHGSRRGCRRGPERGPPPGGHRQ